MPYRYAHKWICRLYLVPGTRTLLCDGHANTESVQRRKEQRGQCRLIGCPSIPVYHTRGTIDLLIDYDAGTHNIPVCQRQGVRPLDLPTNDITGIGTGF
jgi:hypothetical protein